MARTGNRTVAANISDAIAKADKKVNEIKG